MGHDSCWSGIGDSCGGGNHDLSCPPSACCPGCGEPYWMRCKCAGKYGACPECGMNVYMHDGRPEFHACSKHHHVTPELMLAQLLSEASARIFAAGVAWGRANPE